MSFRVFGIAFTVQLLIFLALFAVFVQMYGSKIPLLNKV